MAFVNEPMGEAGVKLIESLKLPDPIIGTVLLFQTHRPLPSRIWSIDRERNLHFFVLCGNGVDKEQPPKYCCLLWDGIPIQINVFDSGTGNYIDGIKDVWEIDCIFAPMELQSISQEYICETIREAFIAYSHRHNDNVISVDFPNMPGACFIHRNDMWRY